MNKKQTLDKMEKSTQDTGNIEFEYVTNIPIAFCRPDENRSNNSIAVWLPWLGGDKETGAKELQKLASHGYFAISIDPWLHGDRSGDLQEDVRTLVFQEFRKYMWQILGITTLDVFRVIDWAIDTFKLNKNVVASGLSMGGDIAIALAGIDARVSRVAAIAASPNWERPGMTDVMDATKIVNQGDSTNLGKWLFNKLNPMTNLNSFARPLQMHIELGELDTHINSQWMFDFKNGLSCDYKNAEHNIEIVVNKGLNHVSLLQNEEIIDRAVNYLIGE
nr:hypothetical protein [uncultured Draconibacterium sp.]